MCKVKMANMGLFITIFFSFMKDMEGIFNPGDLSCKAGCDFRKPATTTNGSVSKQVENWPRMPCPHQAGDIMYPLKYLNFYG